jgi:hypothetical protein
MVDYRGGEKYWSPDIFERNPPSFNTLEDGFGARTYSEFMEDTIDMSLNGANANTKRIGDILVSHTSRG